MKDVLPLDHWLFHQINKVWVSTWADQVFPFVTDLKSTRMLLGGIILTWILLQKTKALKTILGLVIAIAIADVTASQFIKPLIKRDRPEFSTEQVRLLVPSQGSPSFPSNHAANTFAAAFFLLAVNPVMAPLGFAIALLVGYSRIYVGVHFPIDVLGGVGVGWLASVAAVWITTRLLGLFKIHLFDRPASDDPRSWRLRRKIKLR
ncbi:MAG: phosphatase PAP2 family protein [Oligoflexia bacterium]|nr:phosphatase PAP2 family protein [Oligoflexia bacterium]